MDQPYANYNDPHGPEQEEIEIFSWLRSWHWFVLACALLVALAWFPLWIFEHRWQQVQVGDTFEQVTKRLGDPGEPAYKVGGAKLGDYEAYVYRRYWRVYEVHVSPHTNRVVGKVVTGW